MSKRFLQDIDEEVISSINYLTKDKEITEKLEVKYYISNIL